MRFGAATGDVANICCACSRAVDMLVSVPAAPVASCTANDTDPAISFATCSALAGDEITCQFTSVGNWPSAHRKSANPTQPRGPLVIACTTGGDDSAFAIPATCISMPEAPTDAEISRPVSRFTSHCCAL